MSALLHAAAVAILAAQAVAPQSLLPGIREGIRRAGHAEIVVTVYMPPIDMDGLVAKADVIADVATAPCHCYLTKDESHIFSDCPVTIEKVLKGPETLGKLTVRLVGGELTVDGAPVVAQEAGFPVFKPGERYVLFLVRYQGTHVVVHGPAGAFRVIDGKVKQVANGKFNDEHPDMSLEDFHALVASRMK